MGAVRALAVSTLLVACSSATNVDTADAGGDPLDTGRGLETGIGLEPCPVADAGSCSSPPSYQNDVTPIVDTYCNNCHAAGVDGGPWPLGGYQNVYDWKELMVIDLLGCTIPEITHGHLMPPADAPSPLPHDRRDVMVSWLLCGAPNN